MAFEFTRMVQFSLLVKAGDRVREFNFRKLKSPEEQFTVNVCDERGERIQFGLRKEEGAWRLSSSSLPPWILQTEEKIGEEVDKELDRW